MSYTYAQRRKTAAAKTNAPPEAAPQRLSELQSGAVKPSAAEMGRRVDLPEAMRARMESSFGADLSAVKLYESKAVGDAGAEAVTQGSNIAFAPGKLDFSSFGGQALLGHELSHVVSQQRGEVTGGGFLNDHALEARADREGAMAARGESVYGGAAAPLSSATAAPAAGPMQAKRGKKGRKAAEDPDLMDMPTGPLFAEAPEMTWKQAHSHWKNRDNKVDPKELTATTGLSQKKQDVLARMNAEMADTVAIEDEEDWRDGPDDLMEELPQAGSGLDPNNSPALDSDSPLNQGFIASGPKKGKKKKK